MRRSCGVLGRACVILSSNRMRRDTALTIASILVASGIVLGPTLLSLRAQIRTEPSTSMPFQPAVSTTRTIPLKRVSDDSRRDFCSMRREGRETCAPVDIRCATGWKKVCQGSCACGGTICQCVKEQTANQPNTCGNGACEPGEYRTERPSCDARSSDCVDPPRLIPICQQDCAALARSGTQESVCYDQALNDCVKKRPVADAAAQKDCQLIAQRLCGGTGQTSQCTNAQLKQCTDRFMARGTSAADAEKLCLANCSALPLAPATPPTTPPPAPTPVGGCTDEEYVQCVERVILQGTILADAQAQCARVCQNIQTGERSYIEQLKKRIAQCDFTTTGRCCEVAKQIGGGLEDQCLTSCRAREISMADKALCD